MPKTTTNSTRCLVCARLIARKNKRRVCSSACQRHYRPKALARERGSFVPLGTRAPVTATPAPAAPRPAPVDLPRERTFAATFRVALDGSLTPAAVAWGTA